MNYKLSLLLLGFFLAGMPLQNPSQAQQLTSVIGEIEPVPDLQQHKAETAPLSKIALEDKYQAQFNRNNAPVSRLLAKKDNNKIKTQQVEVSGQVTSGEGDPLPGVNVVIQGTSEGTVTDVNGEYSLPAPEDGTLVFSFVGYQTREVEVNGRSTIDVTMQQDVAQLDEVVVVGYGTQQKRDLTGSISNVSGEDIMERKTTSVSQALQGAVSGVSVTRSSGEPGSGADIKIRGVTTIGNTDPLIVVDGVPRDNIDNLNPNNIADITVLKDAASASIYGARAAAGVILIQTKRAQSGELNISYDYQYGVETPTETPEYVSVTRQMEMLNELTWNDNGNTGSEFPTYEEDVINNYYDLNAQSPDEYPITNWQNLIMRDYAPKQRHNLRLSGGTDNVKISGSMSYEDIDGIYIRRNFKRINSRINTDISLGENFDAELDGFYKRDIQNRPSHSTGSIIYRTRVWERVYDYKLNNGRVASGKGGNPWAQVKYGGFEHNWNSLIGGRLRLNYSPIEDLELSGILSPQLQFEKGKWFRKAIPYYAGDDPNPVGYIQGHEQTNLSETRNDEYQGTMQFLANYSTEFGGHSLSAMAGHEEFKQSYESLSASRDRYPLKSYPYLDIGPLTYRDNSGSAWENAYRSWFGRVSYNFENKYYLQANIRYDGSSRFHPDYRWGSYPSFSAGWEITEESFMQNTGPLSFLKLRASYGTLGNERIGNYPYQATMGFSDALMWQGSSVVSAQTAAQWQYAIQDITWETTETYNVGVDANFFDNRLGFIADYYQKYTRDMLLALEIPNYMGFDNPDQNTGRMHTKGWDLEVNWRDNVGELSYRVGFNLSDSKTKMGELGGIEFKGSQITAKGTQYQEWYGYKADGLFQTQQEVDNSATTSDAVRPGDVKYVDISGPEGEPDGEISPEYDRVTLGGSLPRYQYGGNIQLNYKNFDFGLVIQGVGKKNDMTGDFMVEPMVGGHHGKIPKVLDGDYWSHYNSESENQNAAYPRLTHVGKSNNYATSNYWMISGAYLRLKNISIGYNLPQSLIEPLNIQNFRIYGNISDLYSFNNYPKGWDPEVSTTGHPITTDFILGATATF